VLRFAAGGGDGRPDVVLDCRWLGTWGAGRVTEHLLRGLAQDPPARQWLLWGPPAVEAYAWPGAGVALTGTDPRRLYGQRSWFSVPPGRLTVFLHQQRPLRRLPGATLIYDTIALRHGTGPVGALARRFYLRRAAAVSDHVITISEYSRRCIRRDLGVADHRLSVIPLPIDAEAAARLARRRRGAELSATALYVGRFAPHKNLDRLLLAFATTTFCAGGGRLLLVGGSPAEVTSMRRGLSSAQRRFVEVRGWCDQNELEDLMATARFLVQPSLEEGFGLPVLEALAGGLPVCVSNGGALPEMTQGLAEPFEATSVDDMARALDACAAASEPGSPAPAADALAAEVRRRAPTVVEYARRFRQVVERRLG
jgi:glycosyltransferase involved in cell wall biosynthesis